MVFRVVSPFDALREFQRALEATQSSGWFGRSTTAGGAFPPINVFSQGDDCVVVAELPGVAKNDISIDVKGNQLRLSGKKEITYDDKVSVHRRERASGGFDRTLTLPLEIDAGNVKAEYRNGMLAVFLPRAEADKPRSVSIA